MRNPETPTGNMLPVVNDEEFPRLWLFEVDVPEGDPLYFAQSTQNVDYRGHTYAAWPIEHQGIAENARGQINQASISIGNLTEDLSAALELYDGLRGQQLRVLQVVDLADPHACIQDIYYIDAGSVGNLSAEFTLSTRMSIMEAQIAPRMYNRSFCDQDYKGRGCWAGAGPEWTAPEGFVPGDPDSCKKTMEDCRRHGNIKRYGGSPSVPLNKVVRA